MHTIEEKIARLSRVNDKDARSELYRITGEQQRRADTTRSRDACNGRANSLERQAGDYGKAAKKAEQALKVAREIDDSAKIAEAERMIADALRRQSQCLADSDYERKRGARFNAQLATLPKGSRSLRRKAKAAVRRSKRSAEHERRKSEERDHA